MKNRIVLNPLENIYVSGVCQIRSLEICVYNVRFVSALEIAPRGVFSIVWDVRFFYAIKAQAFYDHQRLLDDI